MLIYPYSFQKLQDKPVKLTIIISLFAIHPCKKSLHLYKIRSMVSCTFYSIPYSRFKWGRDLDTKGHTWHLSVDQRRSVCAFHVKAPKSGVAT